MSRHTLAFTLNGKPVELDVEAGWTLMQVLRLCLEGEPEPDDMPPGLVDLLCRSTDLPEIKVLEAHLAETAKRVRGHFRHIVG